HHITGREGKTLAEVWSQRGMAAYKGTTIHGFPNLFQIVGPNTGLGHSSMVFIIESQIAYVRDAIRTMQREGHASVEPRADVQDAWNDDLQRRMQKTVWNTGGCASWYLDAQGNNTTLWPTFTWRFRRATRKFHPAEYIAYQHAAQPVVA
ncbi:MAG: 4-hydroxyacetophenone monooxygenase, partial [Pseudonocardiaceae bacterium]